MSKLPPYKIMQIALLVPYARNARTHTDAQVAEIAASIQEFGWTNPVLVDAEGVLIAGHGRLLAAQMLGIEEVPAIVLGHLSDAQKRALALADNKIALNAGWDQDMLRMELSQLRDDGFALDVTGFSLGEVDTLLGIGTPGDLLDPTDGHGRTSTAPRMQLAWGEMSWRKVRVPITEEEAGILERALAAHKKAFGTDFGFVRETLARLELRET